LFRAGFPRILSAAVSEVSDYLYKEITKKVFLYPSLSEGAVEGRLSFHFEKMYSLTAPFMSNELAMIHGAFGGAMTN